MEGEPTLAGKYKTPLSIPKDKIVEADYKSQHIPPVILEGCAKVENENKWQTYRERISQLENQHKQSFSMIQGPCVQVILDHMTHDPYFHNTSYSYVKINGRHIVRGSHN